MFNCCYDTDNACITRHVPASFLKICDDSHNYGKTKNINSQEIFYIKLPENISIKRTIPTFFSKAGRERQMRSALYLPNGGP
jgi:hypothetical protein